MSWLRVPGLGESPKIVYAIAAAGTLGLCIMLFGMHGSADDFYDATAPQRQHAQHGTHYWVEVVESFNAKYEGDSPGHIGRGGGIELHPHVALGDPVYHRIGKEDEAIGVIAGVTWDRLKGSLTFEFHPKKEHRIAVGDLVWIDLNPMPRAKEPQNAGETQKDSNKEQSTR